MIITGQTGACLVAEACERLTHGPTDRVADTRELRHVTLACEAPGYMMPVGIQRSGLRPALGIAEGLHLIAGTEYGELMAALTADIDSVRWQEQAPTAVALAPQMQPVLRALDADPATRRGYVNLWNPEATACAVGIHWMRRHGRLMTTVTMRSNDVWHGLPYNLVAFGMLACTVAYVLDVIPGWYHHDVHSLHLYDRHRVPAALVRRHPTPFGIVPFLGGLDQPVTDRPWWEGWKDAQIAACTLLAGNRPGLATPTEELIYRTIAEAVG